MEVKHTPAPRMSDLREAAYAGYMAACREIFALVEETRKSSNIVDDFTRGRCHEAKSIARTMGAIGPGDSEELRKALGVVMRAAIATATPEKQASALLGAA
jgi:hypothetical protein